MAAISQTIPSYALGISQQSDEAKLPGQVRDALNVIPDITDGLIKRPGTQYVNTFTQLDTEGKWFNYFRDENEGSYIGRVNRNGNVRVWRADDGYEMTIQTTGSPSTYLTHLVDKEIQALTINDTTFLSNSALSNSATAARMNTSPVSPSKPDANSVYVELKQVAPRRQYALNIYDNDTTANEFSATSVQIISGINNNIEGDPDCRHTGSKTHIDTATGIAVRVTCIGQPFVSGYSSNSEAEYDAQYTLRVDLLYGGSYSSSLLNQNAFTVDVEGRTHTIKVTGQTSGSFKGNIHRIRPVPVDIEQETSVSTSSVLNSIKEQITASGFTASIIGNGIYIVRSGGTPFNVESIDGDLFNIVKDEINDVTSLPTACKHGYILKVINSQDTVVDDYFLKFFGENNRDGEGHWEECQKPGQKIEINANTMPHVLRRTGATTMSLGPYEWADKEIGTEFSNKNPSFLSTLNPDGSILEARRISKVLFHRNRLVMLSGSNIILSQPEDLGNFWNKTALTFSGVDRIDISCSSSSPNSLVDGIEMNTGLLLFSATAQFLFATDSDILNPKTAKVYSLSNYFFDAQTPPFSLGTSVGFVNTQGKYSRFFEMTGVRREGEPEVIDQTKSMPRFLPQFIDMVGNSKENTHLFFTKKNTNNVFAFKYFNAGDKRLQGAWFRWSFPYPILHHYVLNNRYYLVDTQGNLSFLVLNESLANSLRLTNSDTDEFLIHLDNFSVISKSNLSFNSSTNKTSFSLPSRFNSGKVAAINIETNDDRGRYQIIDGSPGGTCTVDGDWTATDMVIGEQYEMRVDLPTIYPTSVKANRVVSDTTSSLTLHRIKFNFGDVGQFNTTLTRVGKTDFTDTYSSAILDGYLANRAPYLEECIRTIPVYERNTNVSITLSSTHPSPATLQSMSWEGDYTNNYYKRI